MKRDDNLLREYIQSAILSEYIEAGDYDYAGQGMYSGGGGVLKKAFVDPIARVFRVFKGRAKETLSHTKKLTKVSAAGIISVLSLGAYEVDYKKIHDKHVEEINKIRSEYGKDYAKSWEILNKSSFMAMAFLYNPVAFLSTKFIISNPRLAAGALAAVIIPASPVASVAGGLVTLAAAAGISNLKDKKDKKQEEELPADLKSKLLKIRNSEGEDGLKSNIKPELWADKAKVNSSVDSFFSNLKGTLAALVAAKTIDDLNVLPDQKAKVQKELAKLTDEAERKKYIDEILKSIKQSVALKELENLKNEREKIINDQVSSGIPREIATGKGSLAARYAKEIKEIMRMFKM